MDTTTSSVASSLHNSVSTQFEIQAPKVLDFTQKETKPEEPTNTPCNGLDGFQMLLQAAQMAESMYNLLRNFSMISLYKSWSSVFTA